MVRLSVCIEMIYRDLAWPERVARVAETGIKAVEFWGPDPEKCETVGKACREHGLEVACFGVGGGPVVDAAAHRQCVEATKKACTLARELGTKTLIVTTGQALEGVCRKEQHDNIVKALAGMGPVAGDAGVRLALEPLNTTVDHAGYYLETSKEGFAICAEVDHPAVGLLYDVYHMQIMEGNLIDVITDNVERIFHFHVADVPGRREPGTGEINYKNVFAAIDRTGYDGYVGLEYRPSGDASESLRQTLALCPA